MKKEIRENCIIIDIDGTIANCDHRLDLQGEDKDWDTFHNLAFMDKPLVKNIKFIKRFIKKHKIKKPVFITGRNERIRDDTVNWICYHCGIWFGKKGFDIGGRGRSMRMVPTREFHVCMRPTENRVSGHELKKDLLRPIKEKYNIVAVFEDDTECLSMYKKELSRYGTQFFLANEGDMARCK